MGKRHSRSAFTMVELLVVILSIAAFRPTYAEAQTNQDEVKDKIIAIQTQVVDLTNPLEPLFNKQFLAMRKSMSIRTARKIVELIKAGSLTQTQSDIGVLLLSGLDQRLYWHFTAVLLTTNTDEEALDTMLNPPLPYGPGYANSCQYDAYRKKLLALKAAAQLGPAVMNDLNLILSGEASSIYGDYLKHPDKYNYPPPSEFNGNQ